MSCLSCNTQTDRHLAPGDKRVPSGSQQFSSITSSVHVKLTNETRVARQEALIDLLELSSLLVHGAYKVAAKAVRPVLNKYAELVNTKALKICQCLPLTSCKFLNFDKGGTWFADEI